MRIKRKPLGKPKFSIGQTFKDMGLTHKIIAIDHPQSYTFIYTCEDSNGHQYKIEQWLLENYM